MKVNGTKKKNEMAEECKFGQTGQSTKDIGRMEKQMDMVDLFTLMDIFKRESGKTAKHMDTVNIPTQMDHATKENGIKTSSMEWVKKFGQMEQGLKVIMKKEKRME